jgi:hypothetical protein
MNTIDKSRVKNAPLELTKDDADFVEWATSIPDGSISAGWQSMHPNLEAGNGMSADNDQGHALDVQKVNDHCQTTRGITATITKGKLQRILTRRLSLVDPEFRLQKAGDRLVGNIISVTFKGKRDHERQKLIWEALEAEFGTESPVPVGLLLAFTPDEWNLGAIRKEGAKVKKAG